MVVTHLSSFEQLRFKAELEYGHWGEIQAKSSSHQTACTSNNGGYIALGPLIRAYSAGEAVNLQALVKKRKEEEEDISQLLGGVLSKR